MPNQPGPPPRRRTGRSGSALHELQIDLVCRGFLPVLQNRGYPYARATRDEMLMALYLKIPSGPAGGLIPDALLVDCLPLTPADFAEIDPERTIVYVIVEVGQFQIDKWPAERSVVHIGFDLSVRGLNCVGPFEQTIVRELPRWLSWYVEDALVAGGQELPEG